MGVPTFALIGTALSVAGTVVSTTTQMRAAEEQSRAARQAASAQEQQMQLDATQRRRQAIRQSISARAMALTTGTNQGASGSSALAGAMANATSQGVENVNTITQSTILGGRVFQAERDAADARIRGMRGQAFGQGIASLGGAFVDMDPEFGRLTGV